MIVRKNLRLSKSLNTRLKVEAIKLDTTRNSMLVGLISKYGGGTPVPATETTSSPSEPVKVDVDSDLWEAALGRARIEGKSLVQAIAEEAERALA